MNILPEELEEYIAQHTSEEEVLLQKLTRETHLKVQMPQMLSGHVQGQLLSLLSQMIQPKRVLEIGTFTGYSAICLARGLQENGLLYTIDVNEELTPMVNRYVSGAGLYSKTKLLAGNALQIIPTLNETWDIVFIDADKINYCNYYDFVFNKVRKGGYIIADNVLWSGKVAEEKKDKDTLAIDAYNKKVQADSRVKNVILSVRDGLNIAQKLV
jgi:predicted O-methyltransferase YrrM